MATIAENNIKALELIAEQLREEFNNAISEYEMAIEAPEFFDVELAEKEMNKCERFYHEALEDIEFAREIAALGF